MLLVWFWIGKFQYCMEISPSLQYNWHNNDVQLKGNPLFTKPFKFFTAHVILLGHKKITSFIVDVMNTHNKK